MHQFNNKKIILILLFGIVLILAVILGFSYYSKAKENNELKSQVQERQTNEKVVNFLNLFVKKVLKAEQEVSFEDRLGLENAIRDIGDAELLKKWEAFTEGSTEVQIQLGVKDLLEALVNKIVIH